MAAVNVNNVWFIVRSMTQYVSRIYKSEKFNKNSEVVSTEDQYLPRRLKILLSDVLDNYKNEKFITAHNHFVNMEDRENHLRISFRNGLLEMAKKQEHEIFLREAALYIMSATELDKLGFTNAIDITMEVLYHVCLNTNQCNELLKWEMQPGEKKNSLKQVLSETIQDNSENQSNSETQQNLKNQSNNDVVHDAAAEHSFKNKSNTEVHHDFAQHNKKNLNDAHDDNVDKQNSENRFISDAHDGNETQDSCENQLIIDTDQGNQTQQNDDSEPSSDGIVIDLSTG